MKTIEILTYARRCAAVSVAVLATAASAQADDVIVEWQRIVGIIQTDALVGRPTGGAPCNVGIDCVLGTPAPWVTTRGYAAVNLGSGQVHFEVKGLVVAGDPSFSNIGTTAAVKRVKGTLVCNDTAPGIPELVDTRSVRLNELGNASFQGRVDLPYSCIAEPEDIVFLIRIAKASEAPFLLDLWNAAGMIRTIQGGGL
jgi:hypothetical protein